MPPTSVSGNNNAAGLRDYIRIARLDHATKQIFLVPGVVLAIMLRGVYVNNVYVSVFLGLVTAICIASANYVINEFLDRGFDRFHPTKSARAAVQRTMQAKIVWLEWLAFVVVGLSAAWLESSMMFCVALVFAAQGIFYNVKPLRTKDKAYLDVISESINNPLRLIIGWDMIDPTSIPPGSMILAYWFGGAFLMAAKRLSEYREIVASHSVKLLERYRASFKNYTELSLTGSCLFYALFSIAFLSIFFIRYRAEYLLLLPFLIILFVKYFSLSMLPGSTAQKPERLFQEQGLMFVVALLGIIFIVASFVSMPWVYVLTDQKFITVQ